MGVDPEVNEGGDMDEANYQDTLEDLEGAELDIRGNSDGESCDEPDTDVQEPDDEFGDDAYW